MSHLRQAVTTLRPVRVERVPDGMPVDLAAGTPARIVRTLSDEEIAWKADGTRTYQDLVRRSLATMRETTPLAAVEAGRRRIEIPDVVPLVALKKR